MKWVVANWWENLPKIFDEICDGLEKPTLCSLASKSIAAVDVSFTMSRHISFAQAHKLKDSVGFIF